MASDLILNGVTFNGTPVSNPSNPRKPNGLTYKETKVGSAQVRDNGSRVWVQRLDGSNNPIIKGEWTISWEKANETTRAALRTIDRLTAPWTFVDQLGVGHSVQTEPGDYEEDYAQTDLASNLYYQIKLTIREV